MATLTPKQLEIRQREDRILAAATPMIRDGGLSAISMEAIAKEMRYTRGTIYNHFPNKEDIVLSLASRAVRRRIELFQFAASLATASRPRVSAVGIACEVFVDRLPDDFTVEQMIRHDSVWQKTSTRRRDVLCQCESMCMDVVGGIVQQAIDEGDFKLPRGRGIADVVLGLWSLVYGGQVLEATSPSLRDMGIRDHHQAIRRNCNAMLDGLGWQALYDATRYNRFVKRITPLLEGKADELKCDSAGMNSDEPESES